jgi:hypothetical protein
MEYGAPSEFVMMCDGSMGSRAEKIDAEDVRLSISLFIFGAQLAICTVHCDAA